MRYTKRPPNLENSTPFQQDPIVILGAHRSGTSLTTRMLAQLGVFVGSRLDSNAESAYMQRLNRRILDEVGAHWSTPLDARRVLEGAADDGVIADLALAIGEYLQGIWFDLEYWGSIRRTERPALWGWKDPRNILLLPVYRALFPTMRIVWVRRHPFDTARSLVTRGDRKAKEFEDVAFGGGRRDEARRAWRLLRGAPLASQAWRASSLLGAVELSLEYAELHEEVVPTLDYQVLRLDYQDLLGDPSRCVDRMVTFLEADVPASLTAQAAALPRAANPGYLEDEELVEMARGEFADRLRALGY